MLRVCVKSQTQVTKCLQLIVSSCTSSFQEGIVYIMNTTKQWSNECWNALVVCPQEEGNLSVSHEPIDHVSCVKPAAIVGKITRDVSRIFSFGDSRANKNTATSHQLARTGKRI